MKKTRIIIAAIIATVGAAAFIAGCTKDTTVVVKQTQAVTTSVSFSAQLVPLFAQYCAITGCHVSGGHAPNLTASAAYSALISGNFVNTGAPAGSVIYQRLTGQITPGMPLTAPASDPAGINELVLGWITQGAANN